MIGASSDGSDTMPQKGWLAALCAVMVLAAGCHNGGHAQNSTEMRAINAVAGVGSIDILVDDDVKVAGLAFGATSPFSEFSDGTHDVKVRSSTTQTVLSDKSLSFGSGANTTLLAFGSAGTVSTVALVDDTASPSTSSNFKLRVAGSASDAGPVDVYVTQSADISTAPPTVAGLAVGVVGDFIEAPAGNYRIFVTVAGTKDVLLQTPAQALAGNTAYTFAVVSAGGGKLVNGILLVQGSGGSGTFLANPFGRIKAVNAVPDSSAFNFKVDGATLLSNVPFAASSSYVTVASGARTVQVEASNVPGTIVASLPLQVDSARDFTVAAVNNLGNAQLAAFIDDNSFPAVGLAKLRFVNLMVGSPGVDVLVNFASQTTGLAFRTASAYYSLAPSTTYTITFTTPGGVSVIASLSPVEIDAGGVYTAYLLGTPGAPLARFARDR
jgi:hypothetical protein